MKWLYLIVGSLLIAIDQLSKANSSLLIFNVMGPFSLPVTNTISVLAAFIALLLIGFFSIYILPNKELRSTWLTLGMIFLVSGGISNLGDRLVLGGVRETIQLGATFFLNLADIYIYLGSSSILTYALVARRQRRLS